MKKSFLVFLLILSGCKEATQVLDHSGGNSDTETAIACAFNTLEMSPSYNTRSTNGTLYEFDLGGSKTLDISIFQIGGHPNITDQITTYYRIWDNGTAQEWGVGVSSINQDCELEVIGEGTSSLRFKFSELVLDSQNKIDSMRLYDTSSLMDATLNATYPSSHNW